MGSAIPAISEILPANRKLQGEPPVRPFRFGLHPQPRSRSLRRYLLWKQTTDKSPQNSEARRTSAMFEMSDQGFPKQTLAEHEPPGRGVKATGVESRRFERGIAQAWRNCEGWFGVLRRAWETVFARRCQSQFVFEKGCEQLILGCPRSSILRSFNKLREKARSFWHSTY